MLPGDAAALGGPVIDAEKKIGVVPMNEGIRVAGMIEMASEGARPNDARANILLKLARGLVPEIPDRLESRWLGHRPGIPDSRPVIGPSPRSDRVLFAFGHGTIGLTLGALTGQIVADLVAGREPPVDLGLFAPTRF
jgi:D-amino-acid dehydrogenase